MKQSVRAVASQTIGDLDDFDWWCVGLAPRYSYLLIPINWKFVMLQASWYSDQVPLLREYASFGTVFRVKILVRPVRMVVPRSHDDLRFRHWQCYGLVRQHLSAVDVELVLHDDIFSKNCGILHADPAAYDRAPAHNATVEPRVLSHASAT